ncbi:MAG: MFS transporter [Chloroflexi bacterium]|nr:MFS transporter [Chloroflexota bacterium]
MKRTSRAGWSLIAILCIPVFLGSLDLLVVSAFLPDLLRELALPLDASGQEAAAWLVNAYLIAYSIALLAIGRLSDLTGWRTALTICLGLYFAGSLLVINYPVVAGVLSPLYGLLGVARDPAHANLHAIVLARIIAAFGAGALASVALSLVSQAFHAERRALAVGIIAAMDTIGWMFGGLWGGVVVQFSDWRTVFLVNLPLIVGTLFLLRRQLRDIEQRRAGGRFDVLGFLLAAGALVAINLGIARINTDEAGRLDASGLWLPLLISFGFAAAFIAVEARVKQPLIQLRSLRAPGVPAAHLINILLGVVLLVALLMIPIFTNVRETGQLGLLIFFSQFTEQGLRDAALIQGGLIGAFALPLALASVLGGGLYERLGGRRTITLGLIVAAAGTFLFWATISLTTPYLLIALAAAVAGAGVGIAFTPVIVLLLDAAAESERGAAAALTLSLRMVAMSITTSFSTAFITQRTVDLVRMMESPNALLDILPHSQYATSPFATAYIAAVNSAIRELFAFSLVLLLVALGIGRFIRSRTERVAEVTAIPSPLTPSPTQAGRRGTSCGIPASGGILCPRRPLRRGGEEPGRHRYGSCNP